MSINLEQVLLDVFKHRGFRPGQREVVEGVLGGRDVLYVFPTGGGKSLCYQLPCLARPGTLTVVISPLVALMADQVQALTRVGVRAVVYNSYLKEGEKGEVLAELGREGGALQLLYTTPEQMSSGVFLPALDQAVALGKVGLFAIDEAHCISSWGHDFRPAYRRLRSIRQRYPQVPLVACTATATPQVKEDIVGQLQLRTPLVVSQSFDRPNLKYEIRLTPDPLGRGCLEGVAKVIKEAAGPCGIVYCHKKTDCDTVATALTNTFKIRAEAYHSGLRGERRGEVQARWMRGEVQVLVATIAFGMGIDKADVRYVIHLTVPRSVEAFYQESGRAGRDGLPSRCVLYISGKEVGLLKWLIKKKYDDREAAVKKGAADPEDPDNDLALSKQKDRLSMISKARERETAAFTKMLDFCSSKDCRRGFLLDHFGEKVDARRVKAKCCDACADVPGAALLSEEVRMALQPQESGQRKFVGALPARKRGFSEESSESGFAVQNKPPPRQRVSGLKSSAKVGKSASGILKMFEDSEARDKGSKLTVKDLFAQRRRK